MITLVLYSLLLQGVCQDSATPILGALQPIHGECGGDRRQAVGAEAGERHQILCGCAARRHAQVQIEDNCVQQLQCLFPPFFIVIIVINSVEIDVFLACFPILYLLIFCLDTVFCVTLLQ